MHGAGDLNPLRNIKHKPCSCCPPKNVKVTDEELKRLQRSSKFWQVVCLTVAALWVVSILTLGYQAFSH